MKLNSCFFFCLLFLANATSFTQTQKELETQRKEIQLEIKRVNKLLVTEKSKEKNALDGLRDLNIKISVRNKLINNFNLEALLLKRQINKKLDHIFILNRDLRALKKDYADMIYKSYRSKSLQNRLMFLMSSQNFYQAYKRVQYMQQYASFRKKQGEEIVIKTALVQRATDSLKVLKTQKDSLLVAEKNQKLLIEEDKKEQEELIGIIKKREKQFRKELQQKIDEEKEIAAKIDKLIKEAIARANKNKVKDATTSENEFILSPEAKALAAKFELNKGRLPWPVKESIITRRFGIQPHPTLSGITINSTGIHFTTSEGSYAEVVFDGEVLAIQKSSEGRKNVLVQHGNYISSYNNLESSLVNVGDKVSTGDKIGKIFTDKVTDKTTLIFVLFKNTIRLNPAEWILSR